MLKPFSSLKKSKIDKLIADRANIDDIFSEDDFQLQFNRYNEKLID